MVEVERFELPQPKRRIYSALILPPTITSMVDPARIELAWNQITVSIRYERKPIRVNYYRPPDEDQTHILSFSYTRPV